MAEKSDSHTLKIVGVAILPKKAAKHLHANLLTRAQEAGILVKPIDLTQPLDKQGPFDLILHKIRNNPGFEQQLRAYHQQHPHVRVLDDMDAIQPLFNRATMLDPLQGDGIVVEAPEMRSTLEPAHVRCVAPQQMILEQGCDFQGAQDRLAQSGMRYPLVVKTMFSDGTKYCHSLGVVHNDAGLRELVQGSAAGGLHPPVLCQQYVAHGGRLFKVYVLGRRVLAAKRGSLDIPEGSGALHDGLQLLDRISAYPSREWGHVDTTSDEVCLVPDPPTWLVEGVAAELRRRLGMHMFNFDMICPLRTTGRSSPLVYVVDVNYYPGFEKLPQYEELMVEFLTAQLGLPTPPSRQRSTQAAA